MTCENKEVWRENLLDLVMPEIDIMFGRGVACFDASIYMKALLDRKGYSARIARGAADAGQDGIIVPHYWVMVEVPKSASELVCDPTLSEWLNRECAIESESVSCTSSLQHIRHIEEPGSEGRCASDEVSPEHAAEIIQLILAP